MNEILLNSLKASFSPCVNDEILQCKKFFLVKYIMQNISTICASPRFIYTHPLWKPSFTFSRSLLSDIFRHTVLMSAFGYGHKISLHTLNQQYHQLIAASISHLCCRSWASPDKWTLVNKTWNCQKIRDKWETTSHTLIMWAIRAQHTNTKFIIMQYSYKDQLHFTACPQPCLSFAFCCCAVHGLCVCASMCSVNLPLRPMLKPEVNIRSSFSINVSIDFWDSLSHWNRISLVCLDWLDRKKQESLVSDFLR